jgi:hypothetical protein
MPVTVRGCNRASMSFLRHTGIYRDGKGSSITAAPSLTVSMSSGWLFLGGLLSSRAHLCLTNRQALCDEKMGGR